MATAKILVINSIGPVVVELVKEESDKFLVRNPVQLSPAGEGQMSFNPLLDFMVQDDEVHEILKSSVSVVVNPNPQLGEAYLKAMNPNAIIMPPEKKFIV
ncbi:hypothetical protein XaC1_267 [Xanthomonas phage XaC1]|nr:hypothetical protein XaC1_267 [Xanthomonas phage XaC1]